MAACIRKEVSGKILDLLVGCDSNKSTEATVETTTTRPPRSLLIIIILTISSIVANGRITSGKAAFNVDFQVIHLSISRFDLPLKIMEIFYGSFTFVRRHQ